ncbi:FAD-dependent oxidoreductase [Rubrobacter tropicus]|uniref:D-amino-acid oxidase n=1 Tax=Rubrobacter tropicus TaxID=2653851 RepID=A0A6G8Q7V0_9ACTN|nr:FAD-dependent oxidoreductase [Rubrobacter tropicus]QIN82512.1 FAD-dependent oxidoreductase [Rubrobacter tropicus]
MLAEAVVIGCGVIGLSTAIRLREAGVDARIVTAELPENTTSAVAAAIWYPYRAYPEAAVLRWGARTFEVFEGLAAAPGTGVRMRGGVELRREPVGEPWWAAAVPGVRRCEEGELPPGYLEGHAFVVPVIEMPAYLRYLMGRFARTGGEIEERALGSLDDLAGEARVLINCAGLGARDLVGDDSLTPIRGQILRVRNPNLKDFVLDEDDPEGVTYIVPRSEDCVLGGTADEGEWETEPDASVAAEILRRCAALEPRLAGAEVLGHRVGLRPGRPEVRLEREDGSGVPIIHNYGHGGSGVTLSWGCAEEAVRLAAEA